MAKKLQSEESRIEQLGIQIETLFKFCAALIPDKELIERAANATSENENFSMSAAPILGAMGIDYEQKNFDWKLRRKRAQALLNLIEVLGKTEDERREFQEKQRTIAVEREKLRQILG